MSLLNLQSIILASFLFLTGGWAGWWLRRYLIDARERQALQNQLSPSHLVKLERGQSTGSIEKADDDGSQTTAKDAEIAKWEQRHKVARKEIEERISIMDEVENDNVELDSALCKSIVAQERLQMLLNRRDELLEVMNVDRTTQESRMLVIKEEIGCANKRIRELDVLSQKTANEPSSFDDVNDVSSPGQQLVHDQQLELLNRELVGKDQMLDHLRQELRTKDSQLDELHLELAYLSTRASDSSTLNNNAFDGARGPNAVINDEAVRAQAPADLFSVAPRQVDKLQKIIGIGVKLECILNDIGIYQFRQIAKLTAVDLRWLDQQLGSFKGRMIRDNWVEQAELLATDKIDEELAVH